MTFSSSVSFTVPRISHTNEFRTARLQNRTEHIRHIRLQGAFNKMERMNGEIRARERVMRILETSDEPNLKGMQIYHNYVRPHGTKGQDACEVAG